MAVNYGSLPFQQQSDLFRAKVNLPTTRWNDLQRDAHDTGFMVAGAIKADLLADFNAAIQKAIDGGTTLREFRKDFESIVAKHGWTGWTGEDSDQGRAWRTRIIYETNLRSSYQAGRWQQLQEGKADRPYLIYRHSDSVATARPEHLRWDGLVVHIDDPWVKAHYPPNGYGCKCTMFSLAERDLHRLGKSTPDTPPDDGTYNWTDKVTGEVHTFPKGIQPFWDYAPGASLDARIKDLMRRKAETLPSDTAKAFKVGLALLKQDLNDQAVLKLGVKSVDFGGRKDIADFVTPVLADLSARGLPLPDHISINENIFVYWQENLGEKFNLSYAAFTSSQATRETYLFFRPSNLYWTKPVEWSQKEYASKWSSTNRRDHTLVHELGHLAHYRHAEQSYRQLEGVVFTQGQAEIARRVSNYASEDPREFVAETFVLLIDGGNKLDNEIMALYRQYGGYEP